jgi:hypothetical protein
MFIRLKYMLCFTGGRNKAQTVAKITAEKETASQKDRPFSVRSRNYNNNSCDFARLQASAAL